MTTGLARNYLLDSNFDAIALGMQLRRPQRESLEKVHGFLKNLPYGLRDATPEQLARDLREINPAWQFVDPFPAFTFSLATGVGKTRLMGALIAYLHRSGMSSDFVILAPRQAILRKLEEECRETSPKYIFAKSAVLPEPHLCHRGNLAEYNPLRPELTGATGPNVFVLSPQLLTSACAIEQRSPYSGLSIAEYLRAKGDLVVLVDESHHIGDQREEANASRSWGQALVELKPKLVFSMTATPRESAIVLYEYDLRRCLREALYTKATHFIVDNQGALLDGDAYDAYTLRFAKQRLEVKERSASDFAAAHPSKRAIKPVLMVCTQDINHANQVAAWLTGEGGFAEQEVLVIHSNRKSEEDLACLASLEEPDNPTRVIVQVHVLDEGWDVANVYVIAPLRNVSSYTNGKQVMGRGLRLPFGQRVGDAELDTLDVLAFGQQTIEDIRANVENDFGPSAATVSSIASAAAALPQAVPDDSTEDDDSVTSTVVHPAKLPLPLVDVTPGDIDLTKEFRPAWTGAFKTGIELGSNDMVAVQGASEMARTHFVSLVLEEVIRDCAALSAPLHTDALTLLIERYLASVGESGARTAVDPMFAAKDIVDNLMKELNSKTPVFQFVDRGCDKDIIPAEMRYPRGCTTLDQNGLTWDRDLHRRRPLKGWARSVLSYARFDSGPEFEMARRLDRMKGVRAWFRNDPVQCVFSTSRGLHSPDFIVWRNGRTQPGVLLLEIKGEHLYMPDSLADAHARDLRLFADTLVAAGHTLFETALVLGSDVATVHTLEDIRAADATNAGP
jgi:superfamily II DNA or RNA helicase